MWARRADLSVRRNCIWGRRKADVLQWVKGIVWPPGRLLLNYFVQSAKLVLGKLTINVLKEN
jgi:hypothetical protein